MEFTPSFHFSHPVANFFSLHFIRINFFLLCHWIVSGLKHKFRWVGQIRAHFPGGSKNINV